MAYDMPAMVAAYRQSGASLKEFARERGISPGRLQYWVYEKSRSAGGGSSPGRAQKGESAAFQEIKLEPGPGWAQSWAAEVSLPRGASIRFSAGAGPEWIAAVVQALQRPC